jgi:pyruvate formate lyase activating enzyme
VEVVWHNCQAARRAGVWVEITTLVIPGVNDASDVLRSIAERIVDDVGPDTPWHLSRYFPAYRFDRSPTPVSTLERAREIGTKARLRYVYLGNVPRHADENTICPECGTILVRRDGFRSSRSSLTPEGRCPRCGEAVPGAGW